jgi:hypothetical protein
MVCEAQLSHAARISPPAELDLAGRSRRPSEIARAAFDPR